MFHTTKRILSISISLFVVVIIFIIIVVDASIGYKKFLKGLIVGALLSKGKGGGGGNYQDQHHYFYPVSYYPT